MEFVLTRCFVLEFWDNENSNAGHSKFSREPQVPHPWLNYLITDENQVPRLAYL